MRRIGNLLTLLAVIILLTACTGKSGKGSVPSGKNEMKYSSLLRMSSDGEVTVAEVVNPWDTAKLLTRYILVPEGKENPQGGKDDIVLTVPLKSLVVNTSVHAGAISELGRADIIRGVADAQFFKLPEITEGLKSGKVTDVGAAASPSAEKILSVDPQGILLNVYEGMDIKGIEKLGVPLLKFAENMEQSPLGRAEWIKLIGALTGERAKADSIFAAVESNYKSLAEMGKKLDKHPTVLLENMYEGVWYIAGGRSYTARMIADAGGKYLWGDDTSTGSLNLSYEQVLDRAKDADIWLLKLFGQQLDRASLLKMDPRYGQFSAVDKGGVWYSDTKATDLFEKTPFHPDLLLADYIAVFSGHPEQTHYFKPMQR